MGCKAQSLHGKAKDARMLYLALAKAYDSAAYWALEDTMRGLGVPERILTLMRRIDGSAEAKVPVGGEAQEIGWAGLQRGAPQGEVISHHDGLLCG